jgi:acetoin utilization protein AcuC
LEVVASLGLLDLANTDLAAPQPVSREVLEWFHTPAYLDVLDAAGRGEHDYRALKMGLGTPDCPLFEDLYGFSALAVGGSVAGARWILDGGADVVFNPSGGFHHAHRAAAAGFCYLNDVVLSAMMLERQGLRVLVIDLDAHHGDGVQDAFIDNPRVTTISIHESGNTLFPGTGFETEIGEGDGRGHCVNLPLPVGTYDAIYYKAFSETVLPIAKRIDPDIVVLELGMDGLAVDPLAHLNLTSSVYAHMVADIVALEKPILAVGGGGYHPAKTVRAWAIAWRILADGRPDDASLGAGLGGLMHENTAWFGGLRDRALLSHGGYREAVDKEVMETVERLQRSVFPLLGV